MATNIYLGNPPENIKKWIIDNYVEPWPEKTSVVYNDGTTWEGLIEGRITIESIPNISNIKEITFGNKQITIDYGTFSDNQYLKSVTIYSTNFRIFSYVFQNCQELNSINIFDDINSTGYIESYAFNNCFALSSVTLPNNIELVEHAFINCPGITSMPNSTTSQVKQWFNNGVFGDGTDFVGVGGANLTITCKDGIVHAVGIWNEEERYSEGWDITITLFN